MNMFRFSRISLTKPVIEQNESKEYAFNSQALWRHRWSAWQHHYLSKKNCIIICDEIHWFEMSAFLACQILNRLKFNYTENRRKFTGNFSISSKYQKWNELSLYQYSWSIKKLNPDRRQLGRHAHDIHFYA